MRILITVCIVLHKSCRCRFRRISLSSPINREYFTEILGYIRLNKR